ncbi:hypothetical protein [Paraflavitalea sp. CAU 1676]|uniref:hypothetical protein n=1 Tax=Paraflavitalea sp. CAU 1676 TaxID=3032598 RepID=UPI0023DAEB54|nr:hypothetical protein [Paraflavitalea sp. CAU 1676]MDF2190520.1 hypothetical protein [Paraflavitalea sp. CAU 1676]
MEIPDLIKVYIKQQLGEQLTKEEQLLWESYRALYPLDANTLFENDYLTEMAREKRKMPSLENFLDHFKPQITLSNPPKGDS